MTYDFNNYEKDALTKPRDKAWENWFKFDEVGKKVGGYIRDVFYRPAEGNFAEQRGLTLEQPNGELVNVGIKHIDFILAKTDGLRLGDPVTIVFEKELAPQVKGNSPTKQFGFYGKNLPENAGNKTVAVLEAEDRKIAAEEKAKVDADFDAAGSKPAEEKKEGELGFEKKPEDTAPSSASVETSAPAAEEAAPASEEAKQAA